MTTTDLATAASPSPVGIGDILGDPIGDLLRRVASGFIDAAGYLLQVTVDDLNGGLRINLAAAWIQHTLASMRYLVFFLIGIMFALQIITAMIRRDPGGLWRAVWGSALAILGGAAAAAIAAAILLVVDQFTAFILGPAQRTAEDAMGRVFAMNGAIDTAGWLVVIIVAGLACLALLLIHLVLIGRNAMLIATVVFAPFAFAGATTQRTRTWIGRWFELLIALAISKFVIAVILTLGFTSLASSATTSRAGSTAQVMTGALWLFVAAFSPLAVMTFVHFAGGELAAHHTAGGGEAVGNARSAAHSLTVMRRLNPIRRRRTPTPPPHQGG